LTIITFACWAYYTSEKNILK